MMPSDQIHASSSYLSDGNGHGYFRDMYGQVIVNGPYSINGAPPNAYPLAGNSNQASVQHSMRTIYLGNISLDISVTDVLDHVKSGTLLTVRPFPEKNGLFITFVEPSAAAHFYHHSTKNHLTINGIELKIGWGKPSPVNHSVDIALQNGATRNVFLGSLDDNVTEESLKEDLSRFGFIEHIRVILEKRIAFVHFLCVSNALRCVSTLPSEPKWQGKRIYYGKDRCTQKPVNLSPQHQPQHQPQQTYTTAYQHSPTTTYQLRYPSITYDVYTGAPVEFYPAPPPPFPQQQHHQQQQQQHQHQHQGAVFNSSSLTGVANRTIYLGNIHPDTTPEDICNVIRGGILSQIRFMPDKHIAFITFVDPAAAVSFFNQASFQYIVLKNRRLKLGWGKPSSLPAMVINAVVNGGSRNVYIGNIDGSITEEKLRHDFSEYGDIELVNALEEKNCAFVNFTSIASAVHAIDGIRTKEEYKNLRINYGKDRCGNSPRTQQKTKQSPINHASSPIEEILIDLE